MKTTIETINGRECTVLWHLDNYNINDEEMCWAKTADGVWLAFDDWERPVHIATALPPLPRNPKPEDAALLYRYAAEGVYPVLYWENKKGNMSTECRFTDPVWKNRAGRITRVTDKDGNQVEVAIDG